MSDEEVREQDVPEGAVTSDELVDVTTVEEDDEETEEVDDEEEVEVVDEDESNLLSDIAQEVREGKWGQGQDRRKRLSDAGYDVKAVEEEVTRLLNQ